MFRPPTRTAIPHTGSAVRVSLDLAYFFVDQCRKNGHKFKTAAEEEKYLIYNYQPVHTGRNNF